jgi:RNA recognition motif-containing protein
MTLYSGNVQTYGLLAHDIKRNQCLAFTTTDYDLRQLFEPYGAVDEIRVIMDRDTGRSKGFGFVEMPDNTTAKTAIAGLQGKELAGRTLTVNEAKPREPRRETSRSRW